MCQFDIKRTLILNAHAYRDSEKIKTMQTDVLDMYYLQGKNQTFDICNIFLCPTLFF